MEKDLACRGFVIVEHEPHKVFFQYCVALEKKQLLYDVPQIGIVSHPCTLTEGVSYGMTLVSRWNLSENELLTLTEDDGESGRRRLVRKTKEWFDKLRESLALPETT